MKTMKKAIALLMAVAMVMGLSVTAFADAEKGSITVKNATIGQTYNVYKIFDATLNSDNTGISYTATEAQKNFYENKDGNPFVFTKYADDKYYVTVKDFDTIQVGDSNVKIYEEDIYLYILLFFQQFYAKDPNGDITLDSEFAKVVTPATAQTAETNIVEFSNLDYGYYFVISSLGAVLTLDSTTPNAEVYDKNNQIPTTDDDMKKIVIKNEDGTTSLVDETTASDGDIVDYQVTVHAVNYASNTDVMAPYSGTLDVGDLDWDNIDIIYDDEGNVIRIGNIEDFMNLLVTKYVIIDTPTNLAIDKDSVAVKVGDTVLEKDAYTVELDENGKLTVTIDWATDEDGDGIKDTSIYPAPTDIVVTYSAEVLAGAADENAKNIADASYMVLFEEEEWEYPIGEHETYVYNYYFDLTKTDGGKAEKGKLNVNVLANAVFQICKKEGGTEPIQLIVERDGVYHVADSSEIAAADERSSTIKLTTEITTPESGKVQVKGLGNGTYYLKETKAPEGYNLLASTVPVTIKDADRADTVENGITTAYGVEIENNTGTELPSTGGIGTTIFYVVGSILVIGAAVLLITKKRMNGTAE